MQWRRRMKSCRLFMCFDYMSQLLADLKTIMILVGPVIVQLVLSYYKVEIF